jgi:hypothetical protein
VSAMLSFICNLRLLKLHIWNRSGVSSDWPFFLMSNISNVWSILPYVRPISSTC